MLYSNRNIKLIVPLLALLIASCKKGTFDINNSNPNTPSGVSPQLVLSAALAGSAQNAPQGGNADFANYYMGYWAVSGDYSPSAALLQYNLNTDFFSANWDNTYTTLANYQKIIDVSAGNPKERYFTAISLVMMAYHYQMLVDLYNNVPYSASLGGNNGNFYPAYDNGSAIYQSLVNRLDSAVNLIKSAPADADVPASYDIMFGKGTTTSNWLSRGGAGLWVRFANTLKLRILLNLSQTSGGPAYIQSHLAGLTANDFLKAGEDAGINPGYSNASDNQQSPQWHDLASSPTGTPSFGNVYNRANTYAVNFYKSTNDPRLALFYAPNSSGVIKGRAFGSTSLEHNSDISGIGPGIVKSPTQDAIVLSAAESLFLQAEAYQRGYLTGDAQATYQQAVTESFRLLGVPSYTSAAAAYYGQNDARVNWSQATDKVALIVTQAWAAYNAIDPYEAWNNWRRLGIPSDVPVSIYPGTTATHIPYRLLYPASEYSYNAQNVNAQGTINPLSSKIFWMP